MINIAIKTKWVLVAIILMRVRADDTHAIEKRDTKGEAKKIVCYYTNWSVYRPGTAKFTPQNINPYLCTHLIYAFGGLDKENGLRPYDKYQDIEQGGYAKFTGLKTYNKNLKTMLAIGGWNEGSARFSNLVADEDRRAALVKNVVKFLRQNNFDGLDLDWEYPAFRDGSKPADKENYASLVKELREEFEREASKTGRTRLLLTMAVPAGIEYIDKGYDVPKLNRYLDFMNILSYDYHSAYEPNVNHHAPLYSLQEESEYNFDSHLTIDHTIKHYLKKGADPEKLVLGIPTYGRSYTLFNPESRDLGAPADGPGEQGDATREKGYLAYYEICENVKNNEEWKVVNAKNSAMGPYAYRANQWVGYDDTDIVKLKAKFINDKGLGGIMYWSIDNDDFRGKCHGKPYPLIEAGKEALLASGGVLENSLPAPTEEKRTKLGLRKHRPKLSTTPRAHTTTTKTTSTTTATPNLLSTPEPPTTPDSGTDFVCKDEGFFPHPRDCKKYFWCLDSGPSNLGIVAHQFTCPSGLLFNKISDSCDYSRNVICNKKSEKATSTTTAKPTTTTLSQPKTDATTSTTTTTTTEIPLEEEYEDEEEDTESQQDPKAIKQLITLIKKLGGINELEKQLKLDESSKEATTPAISKNLYNKVFSGSTNNRFRNQHRNAPAAPQNEGLTSSSQDVPYYRKDKPQYVTIQRSRPSKNMPQDTEDSGTTNKKSSIQPSKDESFDYEDTEGDAEEPSTSRSTSTYRPRHTTVGTRTTSLKYVVLERHRPNRTTTTTENDDIIDEAPSSTTHRYITLNRHRSTTATSRDSEEDQPSSTDSSVARTTTGKLSPSSAPVYDIDDATTTTTDVSSAQKVSHQLTSTATHAPSVTSAQRVVVTTPVAGADLAPSHENNNVTSLHNVRNETNAFLVFPQKVFSPTAATSTSDTIVTSSPLPATSYSTTTDAFTTSIATTVITTVRESATEITRIPLRMYREYFKKNRTGADLSARNDLRSNTIGHHAIDFVHKQKTKEFARRPTSTASSSNEHSAESTESSTKRSPLFSRNRHSHSFHPHSTTTASSESIERTNPPQSKLFRSRQKAAASSRAITESTGGTEQSAHRNRFATHSSTSKEDDVSFKRVYKFTPKADASSSTESSYFKSRSSQQENDEEVSTLKPSSRHYTRNKKTSVSAERIGSSTSTTHSTPITRSSFIKDIRGRKSSKDVPHSNEQPIGETTVLPPTSSTSGELFLKNPIYVPDQVLSFNSNEQSQKPPEATTMALYFQKSSSIAETSAILHNAVETRSPLNILAESIESSSGTNALPITTESIHLRTVPRNNSRFLKYPDANNFANAAAFDFHRGPQTLTRSAAFRSKTSEPRGKLSFSDDLSVDDRPTRDYNTRRPSSQSRNHFDVTTKNTLVTGSRNRPVITNRGSIKAKNSLSRAEIKELVNLVETTTADKSHLFGYPQSVPRPINRIEETSNVIYENVRNAPAPRTYQTFLGNGARGGFESQFVARGQPFEYTRVAPTLFNFNDRNFDVRTESHYLRQNGGAVGNTLNPITESGIIRASPTSPPSSYADLTFGNGANGDLFGASETRYASDDQLLRMIASRLRENNEKFDNTDDNVNEIATDSSQTTRPKTRGNFRRNNVNYSRSRSTTSSPRPVTTEFTSYTSNEPNKLANRFKSRIRKGRPENRSVNSGRNENYSYIPLSESDISTGGRHKNNDITENTKETSTVASNLLPIASPLQRYNETTSVIDNQLQNSVKSDEYELQTTNPIEYGSAEYLSDLANPAVAAISHLKTMPPVSSQAIITKTVAPYSTPTVTYTTDSTSAKELVKQQFLVTAVPKMISIPTFQHQTINHKENYSKLSGSRASTTARPSSLQDIYNDYQEPEFEFHADPVDIPISGKVRIHSDGYIECLDMGNFPHPFSCKKFISCAKMEYDTLLGWEYTCPKGLSFDPIGGICNWAAGLGCKE